MAEIKTYPLLRHLRAEPTAHVLRYRRGKVTDRGAGLAFWFWPGRTAVAEIPLGDQELPFVFHARSKDFQELIVQGVVTFHFADPELVAQRIDFTLDLATGRWTQTPLEQVQGLLVQMAQQYVIDELLALELRAILADGVAPIRDRIAEGLAAERTLADLGVAVVAVRVAAMSPEGDVQKALQQPTREAIQQQADQATFARRALAVEKERAIAENELANKIELARREEELVEREGANDRRRAQEQAAAAQITAKAADEVQRMISRRRADAVKEMEVVRVQAERERAEIETGLGAQILMALAASREQVRFFLEQRGQSVEEVQRRHQQHRDHHARVLGAVPPDWRRASIQRADLDRFLFEPEDVVVALGQDGLVANVAKYLDGQPVIGLNPQPDVFPGALVAHPPDAAGDLMTDVAAGRARIQHRTMVRARLDDGQSLLALNEIFVGHASHQSARYRIALRGESERHSSSGVIVATGTGATGWAASLHRERRSKLALPGPEHSWLAFFVREPWPSAATGTTLTEGVLADGETLRLTSELGDGGVLFGDGIETDRLQLDWGQRVEIGVAERALALVD